MEFALKTISSYGVGRVSSMFMYPMSFEEFLWAAGKEGLPLGSEVNEKFTRYIYLDTGLMLRILDLDFGGTQPITELILAGSEEELVNKGNMAEIYVGWELVKAADVRLRYAYHQE